MRKIKLIVSIILVLSMISCISIYACGICNVSAGYSYHTYNSQKHIAECNHCHYEFEEDHTPVNWQHQGTCWDDYNKFHEFTCECAYCSETLFYLTECTGEGCVICATWGN